MRKGTVIEKKVLVERAPRIIQIKVEAPTISKETKAGQFVILMVSSYGERIPLTVVNKEPNIITLIFQEVGFTTKLLGAFKKGDQLYSLMGPLGKPTEVKEYGKVIAIGGGVGCGLVYPVVKALKEAGNYVVSILGAKTKDFLILKEEIKSCSDRLFLTTEDGSEGRCGMVTDILSELLEKEKFDLVYCVGPVLMMKAVSESTLKHKVKTIASLNPIMVDGTGLCGSCRVVYKGKIKYACCEGPEFDAHFIDFDDLLRRNSRFVDKEKEIFNFYKIK